MTLKFFQSPEQEIAVLRTRLEKQDAELYELRQHLSLNTIYSDGAASRSRPKYLSIHQHTGSRTKHHSGPSSLPENLPSFAQPTRASLCRTPSSGPDTEATTGTGFKQLSTRTALNESKRVMISHKPQSPLYRNGKLVERRYGYLTSTKSTLNRFGWSEELREQRCGVRHPSLKNSWEASTDGTWGASSDGTWEASSDGTLETSGDETWPEVSVASPQPPKAMQIMTQEELMDKIEWRVIALRTRLRDNAWVHERANNVLLDHDESFDKGIRGEKLAKRCLFKWLQVNRYETCKSKGIHCLSDIDLGRDRVYALQDARNYFSYRDIMSIQVVTVLEEIIELRNQVHHFVGSQFSAPILDKHLYHVQLLSVLLYDEETAAMVRGLRDRLRREAEGASQEVEVVRLFTALPFSEGSGWRPHHLEMFNQVDQGLQSREEEQVLQKLSPSVIAAALEYIGCRNDSTEWDREPDAEEILASREEGLARIKDSFENVQRLEKGGHREEDTPHLDNQRGRVAHQAASTRWRSASTNGHRILSLRSGQGCVSETITRRRSLAMGLQPRTDHYYR